MGKASISIAISGSYNAALQVGANVIPQSLMDYLQ